MKRTEIKYVETDRGYIKVIGFENAGGFDEIQAQYGGKVAEDYIKGYPMYVMGADRILAHTDTTTYWVRKGTELSKEEFTSFISILKAAGNRLIELAKANQPEEKTILI